MIDEYKEKEDTDEIVPMPDEEAYGLPTEATPIPKPSQLEVEVREGGPHPLQLEKGANGDDDTRILTPEKQEEKPYEKALRDVGFAEALMEKVNGVYILSTKEYTGQHVYVWYNQNSDGEWNLHHTHPEKIQINVEDTEIPFGEEKKFIQFAYFGPYNDRQLGDLTMRVNKYSLTPKGKKEEDNWKLCKKEMIKRGVYEEESSNLELTKVEPTPGFPQKQ